MMVSKRKQMDEIIEKVKISLDGIFVWGYEV
jgi:hypothetical protein